MWYNEIVLNLLIIYFMDSFWDKDLINKNKAKGVGLYALYY